MNKLDTTFEKVLDADDNLSKSGEMSVDVSLLDKESPPPYVTYRKGIPVTKEPQLREELLTFQNSMMSKLESLFSKQDEKFSMLLAQFEDVKTSINFISDKYDTLEQKTQEVNTRVADLENKFINIQSSEARVVALEAKLEYMEQKSRSCNIEISNMPERRGENLISIMEQIAKIIKLPNLVREVIAIHRVPQLQTNSQRPKNVIVKFSSEIMRNNCIAAARLNKGITSEELQIHGNSQKIYINEHLTLYNKKLFRQTREIGKQHGYRFIWVKNSVIFARADVSSPAIVIKSDKDLSKLVSHNHKQ